MAHIPTADQLDELAHAVVTVGLDARRDDIADLVRSARSRGVRPVLADVLADVDAPRPVRERALGLLLVALAAHAASPELTAAGAASAA
jgi:hypothetical protein